MPLEWPKYEKLDPKIKQKLSILEQQNNEILGLHWLGEHDVDSNVFQVEPRTRGEIRTDFKELLSTLSSTGMKRPSKFIFPARSSTNKKFSYRLNRNVLCRNSKRGPMIARHLKMLTHTIDRLVEQIAKGSSLPIRGLYYTSTETYYKDPVNCHNRINDCCCFLRCTRESLPLIPDDPGRLIGPMDFRYSTDDTSDVVDCMTIDGVSMPRNINGVGEMRSTAKFILYVESDAIFTELVGSCFHREYPCVIVTGGGNPGQITRKFVRLMWLRLRLPILGIFDADKDGVSMLCNCVKGSDRLSFDSKNLAIPGMRWVGLRPSDIKKYKLGFFGLMEDDEVKQVKRWATNEFFPKKKEEKKDLEWDEVKSLKFQPQGIINKHWVREVKSMIRSKRRLSVGALNMKRPGFLYTKLLPEKLREGDWK